MPRKILIALLSLSALTACQSTQTLTVSYKAIEVPAETKPIDPVPEETKAEPIMPVLPAPGLFGASDIRAQKLGLYAVELKAWGRSLVKAIDKREAAEAALSAQLAETRARALARIQTLQSEGTGDAISE